MTDRRPPYDQNETPEDVATLYSWANLHGAKYRDFSASRAQTREKARLRVQQAIEEEQAQGQQNLQQQTEAERAAEIQRMAEAARAEEDRRRAELAAQQAAQQAEQAARQAAQAAHQAEQAAQQAAQEAAQRAARQAAEQAAEVIARRAAQYAAQQAAERAAQEAAQQAQAAQRAAQQLEAFQQSAQQAAQQAAWQQPLLDRFTAPAAPDSAPETGRFRAPQLDYPGYAPPQAQRPVPSQPQHAPMREESHPPPPNPWAASEQREDSGRPAWLMPDRPDVASQPAVPQAPEDTLQGSRDRLTSRWYALRGVFEGVGAQVETAPAQAPSRAPVVAVFSLAGGVGKTSLVATLGRALSGRGERVLLVDTAAYGLLPFFFGAHDQRPGLLRTFSPPGTSGDAPIQMVTVDPETLGPETATQEGLTGEIAKYSRGVSRVIVDLATASGATTRRVMRTAPLVLVPLVPDMNSVVSLSSIDSFFQHNGGTAGKPSLPYYVLNQFDPSLPLHLDIREVLREQLGDRLLPFVIRHAPAVSEALAEGMTVMDYAPNSTVAEDFGSLAGWVKSQSAPASSTYRGVRWSER